MLARVTAYDWLVSLAATPLGYALGPILAGAVGFTWPLAGAAALVVVAISIGALMPDVRNMRIRAVPEPAPEFSVA